MSLERIKTTVDTQALHGELQAAHSGSSCTLLPGLTAYLYGCTTPTSRQGCHHQLCALQAVKEAKLEELPWWVMAILHILAVQAMEVPDASTAALVLLDACSICTDCAVQTALREVLHAAMQRQPRCAGEVTNCPITLDITWTRCLAL